MHCRRISTERQRFLLRRLLFYFLFRKKELTRRIPDLIENVFTESAEMGRFACGNVVGEWA